MTRINIKDFKTALKGSIGIKASIAKKLGVSRQAVSQYIHKNPKLNALIDDERSKAIDLAENKLLKKINEENEKSIIFMLKTRGKNRGYVEKQEIAMTNDKPITINLIEKSNEKIKNERLNNQPGSEGDS